MSAGLCFICGDCGGFHCATCGEAVPVRDEDGEYFAVSVFYELNGDVGGGRSYCSLSCLTDGVADLNAKALADELSDG